jgi:hypothetical protein
LPETNFNPRDFEPPEVTLSKPMSPEPTKTNKTANQKSKTNSNPQTKQAQKASFFGVIIMLSLLMTVLGVIYVAYTAVQNDLQKMTLIHSETLDTLSALQVDVITLKEQLDKGGDTHLFDQFIDRIENQQLQLNELRQAQPQIMQQTMQRIEAQMEARLQALLTQLAFSETAHSIAELNTPVEVVAPVVPRAEQKVVRLVETKAPVDPDVTWIKQQVAEHFVLQLASMPERSGIEKVMADKRIQGGRIIPQLRDGRKSYVLVVGSYSQRVEANQIAIDIKEQTGISPWIRRISDLSGRVE